MRVWREDARAKHDGLDAETDEQDVAEEPHGGRLVLLIAYVADQGRLIDVSVLEKSQGDSHASKPSPREALPYKDLLQLMTRGFRAVGQWPLLRLAGVSAPPRDSHASVIEWRWSRLLSSFEPREGAFVESAVHSACH